MEIKEQEFYSKIFDDAIDQLTGFSIQDPANHYNDFNHKRRFYGCDWPLHSPSMIGVKNMKILKDFVLDTIAREVPGDFIETGVWRGGACILVAYIYKILKIDKKVFVCDSFEGLPPPDPKYIQDSNDIHHTIPFLKISLEEVKQHFANFNVLNDNVVFVKGWFKDTLHVINNDKFSILRLDGDMYGSTIESLDALYHKLSLGGYCIVDDYGLEGCSLAIHDFRNKHTITEEIIITDESSKTAYWKKSKDIVEK